MRILIRNDNSNKWEIVDPITYSAETELQQLLADTPSLLPVSELREEASPLVATVREFGLPGSGQTDILAFSADGDIAVIECKLAANAESKRKVIGQILEYGAYLWDMSYGEVDRRVNQRTGMSLADLVKEAIETPDWDEEEFRSGITKTLEKGSFILIIAVDEINEELSQTIRFLNGCGNPAFTFNALEMRRFKTTGTEILIPHLHGPSFPQKTQRERKQWTEEEFFQTIENSLLPDVTQVIQDLYDWSKETANRIWFGTGKEIGSFTFHYLLDGNAVSVFSIYTNGNLALNFGYLSTRVDIHPIENLHQMLMRIPGFKDVPADFNKFPSVKIADVLVDQPNAVTQFEKAVEELGANIRNIEG